MSTLRSAGNLPVRAGPRELLGEALLLRHVAGELRRDLRARLAAGGGAHPGREPGEARRQLLQTSTLWRLLAVRPAPLPRRPHTAAERRALPV